MRLSFVHHGPSDSSRLSLQVSAARGKPKDANIEHPSSPEDYDGQVERPTSVFALPFFADARKRIAQGARCVLFGAECGVFAVCAELLEPKAGFLRSVRGFFYRGRAFWNRGRSFCRLCGVFATEGELFGAKGGVFVVCARFL